MSYVITVKIMAVSSPVAIMGKAPIRDTPLAFGLSVGQTYGCFLVATIAYWRNDKY
jgi:hypothetical protein